MAIGASAGGMEAYTQLFPSLPSNTGMAFIVVQHLDPKHESLLPGLIGRMTQMPVIQAEDGMRVKANQVYIIPPKVNMAFSQGALTSMVRMVFDNLRSQEPERDLQLTVGDLPPALCDQSLLYQVMLNLLDNAVKFTKSKGTAVIEVGGRTEGKEDIYYVKDNGVGFDERYANKLFGVFQRLHRAEEYEGTGIGLAIVKRIIERRGGRVWAEGRLNKGATFYFALPRNEK